MSTDFITNTVNVKGAWYQEVADTPTDVRTRVETEADILSIPYPYVGMIVYVRDTGKRFEVLTLKDKKVGPKVTPNALVDTYQELVFGGGGAGDVDLSNYATKDDLALKADADAIYDEVMSDVDFRAFLEETLGAENVVD